MTDLPPSDELEVEIDIDALVFETTPQDDLACPPQDAPPRPPEFEGNCTPQAEADYAPQVEVEWAMPVELDCAPLVDADRATPVEVEADCAPRVEVDSASLVETDSASQAEAPGPAQDTPAPTTPPAQLPSTPPTPPATTRLLAQTSLPHPFDEIVAGAKDERVRSLAASTLLRILKSLEALRAVEEALTRQKVLTVGALFARVRTQALSLLKYLTEAAVREDGLDKEFREVLDGVRFVMAHEMGKVFNYEFPGLTSEGPSKFSRAELTRAWGLLNNCLQQTAITLARALDPDATGQQLFEDYRAKTENSLTLYRELNLLLQKVKMAEKANGILLKHSLVRHLEHFREETMHFLMYKDWGEFGRFVDEVKRAFEEMEEFDTVLHGFAQYLFTLIHHVGMREVLNVRQGQPAKAATAREAAEVEGEPAARA